MKLFSERYNYVKVSDVIIRETITPEIQNAICSCYDNLEDLFEDQDYYTQTTLIDLKKIVWTKFFNRRARNFDYEIGSDKILTSFIEDNNNPWYKKLDLVEFTIKYLYKFDSENYNDFYIFKTFTKQLNDEFERLNFTYRIINTEIIEITSQEELATIETSIHNSQENIRIHLNKAIELYAQRPNGDYRNSIKESISAVEAYCREITGEKTLGNALNKLHDKGVIIPNILKVAFDKLYAYTNQPDTGIRHALMDDEGGYIPASEEALFMLVSCSAFINYLHKKV